MKIFELRWTKEQEREWIAADTNIHALIVYQEITDHNLFDFDAEDEIVEVPKEEWGSLTISNTDYDSTDPEDWETMTFEEYMKTCLQPGIIAGTMYE